MGFKFRKSVKIAPGVRVNFGKKSTSVSFGTKGFRKTYSSTGRKTTSVGIPGTGISYSKSTGTKKKAQTKNTNRTQVFSSEPVTPQYSAKTYKVCGIILQVIAVPVFLLSLPVVMVEPLGFILTVLGIIFWFMGKLLKKASKVAEHSDPD